MVVEDNPSFDGTVDIPTDLKESVKHQSGGYMIFYDGDRAIKAPFKAWVLNVKNDTADGGVIIDKNGTAWQNVISTGVGRTSLNVAFENDSISPGYLGIGDAVLYVPHDPVFKSPEGIRGRLSYGIDCFLYGKKSANNKRSPLTKGSLYHVRGFRYKGSEFKLAEEKHTLLESIVLPIYYVVGLAKPPKPTHYHNFYAVKDSRVPREDDPSIEYYSEDRE